METPQPPQISVSGRIVVEGQLPASGASPETPPPLRSPPWWEALTAKATFALALGTVALAIVSLVALLVTHADNRGLIKQTRIASKQQHDDTLSALRKTDDTISTLHEQATALKDQAAALKGQLKALRAFVALKGFDEGTTILGGVQLKTWTPVWINTGNTATNNLIIYSYCYLASGGEDQYVFPLPGLTDLLAPRDHVVYGTVCVPPKENLDKVRHGDGRFFIIGKADYDDILGERHTTQYCGELLWNDRNSETDYKVWNCLGSSHRNCADSGCPGFSSGR